MGGLKLFKRESSFSIITNGNAHTIRFENASGKYSLYVDDVFTEAFTPSNFVVMMFGDLNDYKFSLDGVQVVIAMRFGRPKIAVDGKYTDTGEEFKEVRPLPLWGYGFVVAVMIPPVFSGTAWDMLIGACFAYTCTHYILKNPDLKAEMPMRIFYCVIITLLSWALLGLFNMLGTGNSLF